MKPASQLIQPYLTNIETFGVPKHLTNVVSEEEAIKLIDIARNEVILECAEIISKKEAEHGRYLDTTPILRLVQKI